MSAAARAIELPRGPQRMQDADYRWLCAPFNCPADASGRPLCSICKQTPLDAPAVVCASCENRAREAREVREREAQSGRWRTHVVGLGSGAYNAPPDWEHLKSRESFEAKVALRELRSIGERFELERSVLILAPSGAGKTSSLGRAIKRRARHLVKACLRDPTDNPAYSALKELARLKWVTASELGRAPSAHRFGTGEEAELIRHAVSASVLILDELGAEPSRYRSHIFDVIDRRYVAKRPTICTSGLTAMGFKEQYGDAMWRRLTEKGIGSLMDLHPNAGKDPHG